MNFEKDISSNNSKFEGKDVKTIGLIGGMSWKSTVTYYQVINEVINNRLGDLNSAKCLLYSINFQEIEEFQEKGEWENCGMILAAAAEKLEKSGADFIVVCSNTMHKVIETIEKRISIPVLHIAEIMSAKLKKDKITSIALLGTKYTMQENFYKSNLIANKMRVLTPTQEDIEIVNSIIFEELCLGIISRNSKNEFLRIVSYLISNGAEGIVLGCTEIGLLLRPEDIAIPVYDTTIVHATIAALESIGIKEI